MVFKIKKLKPVFQTVLLIIFYDIFYLFNWTLNVENGYTKSILHYFEMTTSYNLSSS